jgi:hypothetical protein
MKSRILLSLGLAGMFLASTLPVMAQGYQGVPVKSGHVSFRYDSQDLTYNFAEGGFQQIQGFTMATLVFRSEAKPKENKHLNITLMFQAPGKVDMEGQFSMNGIGMFWSGDFSGFTKGKSKCTITLTKASSTEVEGTAECPLLHEISGEVAKPLSSVKFYATTK